MSIIANTTVAIYRESSTDEYLDEVDGDTPLRTGIPASLIEGRPRQVESGTSTTPRFIRVATLRVDPTTDLKYNDRIKDERTGTFWTVGSMGNVGNPAYATDLRVDLSTQ